MAENSIRSLKGAKINPIILNSLSSDFYIIPKDNYYKFFNYDAVRVCNNKTLLVLSKQLEQVKIIMIDRTNIKECIVLDNELKALNKVTTKESVKNIITKMFNVEH